MAHSPSHRFGQIIGDALETAIRPILQAAATELGMYLDAKGERKVRGSKRKVAWMDGKGNSHDLDYVFEAGGNDEVIGLPRAFIEIAWRRYTKHSRNKAQEIQGAIIPLAEKYSDQHPFLGVVLGGVFTTGSLTQLRSHGFSVLYFPYESVIKAFAIAGIDAGFDEETPDRSLLHKVKAYKKLKPPQREGVAQSLRNQHKAEIDEFVSSLKTALTRQVAQVYVLPLHGLIRTLDSIVDAIMFIEGFDESSPHDSFTRYEVGVRYNNSDEIRGQFKDKTTAITFLRGML
ncbi:MAG TPA: hypothetical protein VMJ32_14400 [Pirellulales bacterium]|nr:hypothetical protein [Pirellulales bacterium]